MFHLNQIDGMQALVSFIAVGTAANLMLAFGLLVASLIERP